MQKNTLDFTSHIHTIHVPLGDVTSLILRMEMFYQYISWTNEFKYCLIEQINHRMFKGTQILICTL